MTDKITDTNHFLVLLLPLKKKAYLFKVVFCIFSTYTDDSCVYVVNKGQEEQRKRHFPTTQSTSWTSPSTKFN